MCARNQSMSKLVVEETMKQVIILPLALLELELVLFLHSSCIE
jgi:hypothetical protein